MFVDRKKILIGNLTTGTTLDITLESNFFPVDNSELIEDKFVKDEVEKSINPIIDYKKIIFKPSDNSWNFLRKLKINLNFYTQASLNLTPPVPTHRGNYAQPGVYEDLGFIFDDVFCRTNRFVNSFIRFSFYDSPYSNSNNLLSSTDIYTQVGTEQENKYGFTLPISVCPISFVIGDPVLEPLEVNEGFQMYWYKDLVDNSTNGEYVMYMTCDFYNAGNGKIYTLGSTKNFNPLDLNLSTIEGENGIRYLKVILKNDNGVYKYSFFPNQIQSTAPTGVILAPTGGGTPSLTFWQITP